METLGLILGSSFASGLNLYAAVATLGLMHRLEVIQLPESLQVVAHPVILGLAVFLYAVEFVADKVPLVDNTWDVIHTFIRPPAAAVLAYASVADVSGVWAVGAGLLAGSIAATAHGAKATTRLAINASPEPVTNSLASLTEDGIAISLVWMATTHPYIAIGIVLVLVVACVLVVVMLYRFFRDLIRRTVRLVRGRETAPKPSSM